MVRCLKNRGRGPLIKGGKISKGLVTGRSRASHKCTGTHSCKGSYIQVGNKGGHYSVAFRQQNCQCLHKKAGGDKKQHFVQGSMQSVGVVHVPKYPSFGAPLDSHRGKCGSGLPVQAQIGEMGTRAQSANFQSDNLSLQPESNTGRFCFSQSTQTSPIFILGPRSGSLREGCTTVQLGSNYVPFPSSPLDPQNFEQSEGGENRSNSCLSQMADLNVVASSPEYASETPPPPPSFSGNSDTCVRRANDSVPGATCGLSHFGENLSKSLHNYNLDVDDLDFLSNHISKGSASAYSYSWKKFVSFCNDLSVDPFSCPPAIIVKYIHSIFKAGAKYRTINNIRSSISKFHYGFSGTPAGQHPLVIQALKATFRLRPPLPKYRETFNIKPVLVYTKQIFGNNDLLSLKNLSFKCVFLTAFSTLSRVSTIRALGSSIKFHESYCVVPLLTLEKQSRSKFLHF